MHTSLVLTLGHNSSAILVRNGEVICGFEEERLSAIKSDSTFPYKSINEILNRYGNNIDDVCIGHWFTGGVLVNTKYLDMDFLDHTIKSGIHHSISDQLTHHDSHLQSAKVFAKRYDFPIDCMAIVADGFGTFGECISIYDCDSSGHALRERFFGYGKSLGMFYQYATAFLNMKMHNHEYKILGYEAHITEVLPKEQLNTLDAIIYERAQKWIKDLFKRTIDKDTDPVVNKSALAAVQHEFNNEFDEVLDTLSMGDHIYERRVIISYYVQSIVEGVMLGLIKVYRPKNLLLAGGLFYNVKLNQLISEKVDKICVMPLAGDQGAGLGVYQDTFGDLKWPGHVYWGDRDFRTKQFDGIHNIICVTSDIEAIVMLKGYLKKFGMVNFVRGSMEYGPRSLCNTSTLAIPAMKNVARINEMNDRTTIMPMAPVMTMEQAKDMLVDVDKVVGSLEYMVITRDIKAGHEHRMPGATHEYRLFNKSTCRPQIVSPDDQIMVGILNEFGPLINTSFNYHGIPIVYDSESLIYSHLKQNETADIKTIVMI